MNALATGQGAAPALIDKKDALIADGELAMVARNTNICIGKIYVLFLLLAPAKGNVGLIKRKYLPCQGAGQAFDRNMHTRFSKGP